MTIMRGPDGEYIHGESDELVTFGDMIGSTITAINGGKVGSDEIVFASASGDEFHFWYESDCCANCEVNDIIGDLDDLIGSPIIGAEEVSSKAAPEPKDADSYTWTFYRFWTAKGHVTIRWLGESNGYYSESVSYRKTRAK